MTSPEHRNRLPPRPWLFGLRAALRVALTVTALVVLYYLLPLDRDADGSPVWLLGVTILGICALMAFQVRTIIRSPLPRLRAVEALATSLPLLLLAFATTYFIMSQDEPSTFNEALSRTDALYFAVTVFSTVGFGDIAAVTSAGRVTVTVQMVFDLLVIGVGLRVVVGATQLGRSGSASTNDP